MQKFTWQDLTAEPETLYQYEIIRMLDQPGDLQPNRINALITEPVRTTGRCGQISAFFNRGVLGTQSPIPSLPKGPNGTPDYRTLIDRINQPGDPLRNRLAGQLPGALTTLLRRAQQESGQCCGPFLSGMPAALRLADVVRGHEPDGFLAPASNAWLLFFVEAQHPRSKRDVCSDRLFGFRVSVELR